MLSTLTITTILYFVAGVFVPRLLKRFGINVPLIQGDANANGVPDILEATPASVAQVAVTDVEAIVAAVLARVNRVNPPVASPGVVNVSHNADGSASVTAPGVSVTTAAVK